MTPDDRQASARQAWTLMRALDNVDPLYVAEDDVASLDVIQRYWAALPWWVKVRRTISVMLWEPKWRIHHALEALKGRDCT